MGNHFLRLTCDTFHFQNNWESALPQKWHYDTLDTAYFLENSLIIFHLVFVQIYPPLLYPFMVVHHWSLVFDNA